MGVGCVLPEAREPFTGVGMDGNVSMSKKVIIAANNMIFTSKIMTVLDGMDVEGIKAIRSEEIFSKAQELRPDLIVIDLNLNGIEAPSLINKLRSYGATQQIPIICYSPNALKDQMKAARSAGATEVYPNSQMSSKMNSILGKYVAN
jgi:CheY-like chemotaxis protein